ncbi:MAG: hypothetical protein EXR98_20780 [Gemmataceae bacterium]|nr:hypothetical protein [Gemmataceae bacterium]
MQTTTPPAPARPKRRWRWKLLGGVVLVILVTPVAFYFITGWWAERKLQELYAEIDAADPNWRWPDLIAELEPPPDEENSATQILKVQELLKKTPFDAAGTWPGTAETALLVRNARMSPERAKTLRALLDKVDPVCLSEARKLKDLPNGRFSIEKGIDNPFAMTIEWIQDTRRVFNVLQADSLSRTQAGDFDGAAESCLALLNAAHAINDHPTLISQLVRMAGVFMAIAEIERLLGQGVVSEPNLAKLKAALEREAAANVLHFGMRGERAGGHQMFSSVREGKASVSFIFGSGRKGGPPSFEDRVLDTFPGVITGGHPEYLRLMHEMTQASKLPEREREEAFQDIEAKIRKSKTFAVKLLVPAVVKVSEASQRTQAHLRSASTAIAAERYRLKKHKWPAALQDLVNEGLLKEIPKDPSDGQALRWKLTPNGGAMVYSIGRDKVDNGGNLTRGNLYLAGIDYGFELWAPPARGVPPAEAEKPGN